MMTYLISKNQQLNKEYEIVYVFANTSREKEETLIFVDNVTKHWNIPIIWVEAIVHADTGVGTTHRVVSYESALRDGEILEDIIEKFGIPCSKTPVCTRESKKYCINSLIRSLGWSLKETRVAIGYRADEPKRIKTQNIENYNHYYPLWEWGIKKPDVATFWNKQPFDLGLIDAEGNCKLCFKKADEKILFQLLTENIDAKWIFDMEKKYENHTPREKTNNAPYRFFRHGRKLQDIIDQYPDYNPLYLLDKSLDETGATHDFDLQEQEDCAESCEPFVDGFD